MTFSATLTSFFSAAVADKTPPSSYLETSACPSLLRWPRTQALDTF